MVKPLNLNIDDTKILRWSDGSCGNSGCTDEGCCCAVCALPIGVSEDDPRWESHDPDCYGCDLCRDSVPFILFRGEGKNMKQAAFHEACFNKILQENPK